MRRLRAKVAPKRPREKEGQFKCSVCEQAFQKREILMGHIKDHYKPVPASPITNQTEAKAVSRSDEEDQVEHTVEHLQDTSIPNEEVQEEQALEESHDSCPLPPRSASSFEISHTFASVRSDHQLRFITFTLLF